MHKLLPDFDDASKVRWVNPADIAGPPFPKNLSSELREALRKLEFSGEAPPPLYVTPSQAILVRNAPELGVDGAENLKNFFIARLARISQVEMRVVNLSPEDKKLNNDEIKKLSSKSNGGPFLDDNQLEERERAGTETVTDTATATIRIPAGTFAEQTQALYEALNNVRLPRPEEV